MYKWSLINDGINDTDKKAITDFVNGDNVRFTNGKKVKEFEAAWSDWLGIKHSLFVSSGSSANFMMLAAVSETKGRRHLKTTGRKPEVITSPIGWVSDVSPIVLMGMVPVFVDVDLSNLSITYDNIKNAITKDTVAINLVHVLGFSAMDDRLVDLAKEKDLLLIEDCCESHGALHPGTGWDRKHVGTFGDVSNFSFYFGHHITTVEGGMVCTDNDRLYELLKLLRSHGMTREGSTEVQDNYKKHYPDLNPSFTFAVPGLNFRNQEINAVLGLSQLNRLDWNRFKRIGNLHIWLTALDGERYFTKFKRPGNSSFALPLISNDPNHMDKICSLLEVEQVEYRRGMAGGGNQTLQPYLQNGLYEYKINGELVNANQIHFSSLYVGNHPELATEQIKELAYKLNNV